MLKNLTFGILAAAIAIAPGAAFAGQQGQSSVQNSNQSGAAINGSTNAQSSTSTNNQQQIQNAQKKAGGYRGNYYNPGYRRNNGTNQSQGSRQGTNQNGAAIDGSVNAQESNTSNNQNQSVRRR